LASTWSWISKRKEESLLSHELEHLAHVKSTVENTLTLIEALKKGDVSEVEKAYWKVKEAERAADKVKDDIIQRLSQGMIHPIDREELLRLALTVDDIAAYALSAARRLLILAKTGLKVPDDILEGLKSVGLKALESVNLLGEAVELVKRNPHRTIEIARSVERLEEEADDIRSNIEEKVIEWCNEHKLPGACILLYNALTALESSTDKCEDTGDLLRSIAILSI
jgi:predicted phosphate transport protein (TIGR00153 family)